MAYGPGHSQHNPPEPGSNRANLAPIADGDGTHRHEVTAEQVTHAARVVTSKRYTNVDGTALRYREDPMLPCCGRLLSSLTVGASYPDAE